MLALLAWLALTVATFLTDHVLVFLKVSHDLSDFSVLIYTFLRRRDQAFRSVCKGSYCTSMTEVFLQKDIACGQVLQMQLQWTHPGLSTLAIGRIHHLVYSWKKLIGCEKKALILATQS